MGAITRSKASTLARWAPSRGDPSQKGCCPFCPQYSLVPSTPVTGIHSSALPKRLLQLRHRIVIHQFCTVQIKQVIVRGSGFWAGFKSFVPLCQCPWSRLKPTSNRQTNHYPHSPHHPQHQPPHPPQPTTIPPSQTTPP